MPSKEEEHLFVTVEGKQFPKQTIGRRVSSFFKKTKLPLGKRLAHGSVRKSVSTKTKESGTQQEAAIVHRVMARSSKTAKGSYVRTNLTKLGAQALNLIERVTAEKQSHGDQNGETSAATSTSERSANVDTLAPTEEHDDNEDSGDHHETPEPVLTTQVPAPSCYSVCLLSSGWVPPTPDRGLLEKEKAAILRVFEREITAGTKVTKEIAQKRCCTMAVLTILATSMSKVKTVVNHVNYIIETRPRSPPPTSHNRVAKF